MVSERLKEKAKKTTEVVGELELPLEPIVEEGEEDEVRNETNPHLQKGKKANVFNVKRRRTSSESTWKTSSQMISQLPP